MKNFKLSVILLAVLLRQQAEAADSAGGALFEFLSLDTNPRAVAMGGAYTALAAGAGAMHYNPAGLYGTKRPEAAFMHNQYFQGITQEYLSYASPKGWGVDFNYLNFSGIRETTLSNPTGSGLGEVALRDTAFGFGLGRKVGDGLFAGAGVKLVRESIAGVSAGGFMLDGGILWKVPGSTGMTLGLAVQNLGPDTKYQSSSEPMPTGLRAGAGYEFGLRGTRTALAVDMHQYRGEDFGLRLGGELLLGGSVPLRAGFNTLAGDGPGISFGAGYISGSMLFDYAYAPFKELGDTHRLSVTMRWGK